MRHDLEKGTGAAGADPLFGIFALGVGLVIISGGIELSVGSMFAILGVIFLDLFANSGLAWPLALAAAVGLGLILGLIHGLLVTKAGLQPFVVTLCGLLIYRGAARFYTSDSTMASAMASTTRSCAGWFRTGRWECRIPSSPS